MGKYEELDLSKPIIVDLLARMKKALHERNIGDMKEVSNEAIEQAALIENPNLVSISLISYALYKLLSKPHFRKAKDWNKFLENLENDLEKAERLGRQEEFAGLKQALELNIMKNITRLDTMYGNFARDVIESARVKQASRIYSLGISLSKAIELTGADRMQLTSYIGSTKIHDRPFTKTRSVEERYKSVKKIMGE